MPSLPDRSRFKQLLYGALIKLGADSLLYARLRAKKAVVILNLHRVSPEKNAYGLPLHPDDFDELLRFVAPRFDVCVIAELKEPERGSGRPRLVLSFDDGYHDFVEYAMPVLDRWKMRANQNLIGSCIETGEPTWNILLYDFLNVAPRSLLREIRLPGFTVPLPDSEEACQRFGSALTKFLKLRPKVEREPMLKGLAAIMERADFVPTRMMRQAEAEEVGKHHELGCHSHSHESMGFESSEFLLSDLARCRELFRRMNQPLDIYAFPNGSHRQEQVELLLENGVRHVLLVNERHNVAGARVLTRVTLGARTAAEAKLIALGLRTGVLNRSVTLARDDVS